MLNDVVNAYLRDNELFAWFRSTWKRCMTISRYHARSCFYPMWLIAGSISDGRHAIVIPNHIPGCVFIIDELTNPSLETLLVFNY